MIIFAGSQEFGKLSRKTSKGNQMYHKSTSKGFSTSSILFCILSIFSTLRSCASKQRINNLYFQECSKQVLRYYAGFNHTWTDNLKRIYMHTHISIFSQEVCLCVVRWVSRREETLQSSVSIQFLNKNQYNSVIIKKLFDVRSDNHVIFS